MKSFDGVYYKHQKGEHAISLIAGKTSDHAFIQVITNSSSSYFSYPLSASSCGETTKIGASVFSKDKIKIHIAQKGVFISGEIQYHELTPIRYDIMGPFQYLPIQCRHKITSLHHRLTGSLTICGETIDFTGGVGYIEGDRGTSFPQRYCWIQCNDFPEKACVTASVAEIPLMGLCFRGCICVVYHKETEYRMATYSGVKILCCNEKRMVLKQGKLRLDIEIAAGAGHKLIAPENGEMVREIRERIVCCAHFKFFKNSEMLFEWKSENASFEYVNDDGHL